jgi:hypothetical protein
MFMPRGLVPGCAQLWRKWRPGSDRKSVATTASEPAE